jgi:hypothetical protein
MLPFPKINAVIKKKITKWLKILSLDFIFLAVKPREQTHQFKVKDRVSIEKKIRGQTVTALLRIVCRGLCLSDVKKDGIQSS